MGSYPTEGANAQTRSEQNRMDCRMTLSSVSDEVTQWFFDDYMSTWIGVVSGVIARGTDFILDYWSVPLHYTAGSTAQWPLEATQVVAVSAQTHTCSTCDATTATCHAERASKATARTSWRRLSLACPA
jgi:hypothetical protein